MTRNPSCHLLGMLAEVPEPRKKKGLRYPLKAMLGVLVVGLLCGHKGYTSIAPWLQRHPGLAKPWDSDPEKRRVSQRFIIS